MVFALWSSPNHMPIQYRILIKKRNQITPHTLVLVRGRWLMEWSPLNLYPVSRMEVDDSSGNSGTSTRILHFGTHVMVNFRPLWKVQGQWLLVRGPSFHGLHCWFSTSPTSRFRALNPHHTRLAFSIEIRALEWLGITVCEVCGFDWKSSHGVQFCGLFFVNFTKIMCLNSQLL